MSAATLLAEPTSRILDVAEILARLDEHSQEALFIELLHRLIEAHPGQEVIPIATAEGESFGYYTTQAGNDRVLKKLGLKAPPIPGDLDDCLSDDELLKVLSGRTPA